MTHGNGLITTAGYDLDYRLSSLTLKDGATNVSALAYAYTDGMNLTGITDGVTAANSNTLGYSLANRLNAASGAWGTNSFTYDGVGNRLTDVTSTKNRQASYGATNNRLTSITENAAAFRSYTYDNAGNTITETRPGESFVYTYNKRNRLTGVTRNTVSYATYGYNALEQLTTRTTTAAGGPVGQVAYTYDLDGHLITEATASSGVKTREYIWLPSNDNSPVDLPLAVIDVATNTISFVHADHLGRPIRMTSPTKTTVWAATWKPWGEVQTLSGTTTNNLRYPGQYFQIETGLHYNHHRMYDPVTGRYTQPDPLRFVDGPSVYAYAKNSPFMRVDRDGKETNIVVWGDSWPGGHSGIYISGPDGNTIYDPSSGYAPNGVDSLGSGRLGSGPEVGSLSSYLQSPAGGSCGCTVYSFPTTPEQESEIIRRASENGGGGFARCAQAVQNVLSGIGPFKNLPNSSWRVAPTTLGDRLSNLLGVRIGKGDRQ
jgi:RHS repeat-associated protein